MLSAIAGQSLPLPTHSYLSVPNIHLFSCLWHRVSIWPLKARAGSCPQKVLGRAAMAQEDSRRWVVLSCFVFLQRKRLASSYLNNPLFLTARGKPAWNCSSTELQLCSGAWFLSSVYLGKRGTGGVDSTLTGAEAEAWSPQSARVTWVCAQPRVP